MEPSDDAGQLRDWQMKIGVQNPTVAVLTAELVSFFKEQAGINYVELTVTDSTTEEQYTLSLRKKGGKEPSELVAIMKPALEQIATGVGDDAATARLALVECGYDVVKG